MLTCHACGSILISDGDNWICASFTANPSVHTMLTQPSWNYAHGLRNPTLIPDKRIGIIRPTGVGVGAAV